MRPGREFCVWWVLLTLLWVELVSSSSLPEIVLGVCCGAIAAGAALLGRTEQNRQYRFRLQWLRWFVLAAPAAVRDTQHLARLLLRPRAEREAGTLRLVPLPDEDEALRAGRRALVVLALGIAPGSYIVDAEHDELLIHELPSGKPRSAGRPDDGGDALLAAVAKA